MFAKSPNPEPFDVELHNNPKNLATRDSIAEYRPSLAPEESAQVRNDSPPDRAKLLIFPPQPSRVQPTWPDYEELFPPTQDEATEPFVELTSALINRRCYYPHYWPKNTVFRIKDVDVENQTVYLNLIYRWVNATQVQLIKNLMPQRPPRSIELNYLIDPDDCSDF
jgi:hypothetical protein